MSREEPGPELLARIKKAEREFVRELEKASYGERTCRTIKEIVDGAECPLPVEVIPNFMGINLASVEGIEWFVRKDGQLTKLTIVFKPEEKG